VQRLFEPNMRKENRAYGAASIRALQMALTIINKVTFNLII